MSRSRLEEIFGPGGSLGKVLAPTYEPRPQQARMACAVLQTLRDSGTLLVEAPTGVGKSLAYLVPGILWAQEQKRPVLVSTFSRTLQDQILEKDIPHIRRMIEKPIRVAVLKGRSNYLCRNRWANYRAEIQGTVEGEELERALGYWMQTTETGDLAEAPLPRGKAASRLLGAFSRICGETRFCSTPRCSADSGCFYKRSRQVARDATLVVVNHSLLVIDLFSEAAGLPEWSAVVIDEGHHLPRVSAEPLSFSVSESSLEASLKALGGRGEPGMTDQLRRALRVAVDDSVRGRILQQLRDLETETARVALIGRAFWGELKAVPLFPQGENRLRYGPTAAVREVFPPLALELCNQLEAHLSRAERLIDQVRGAGGRETDAGGSGDPNRLFLDAVLEAQRHCDDVRAELLRLEGLVAPDRPEYIYWIEPSSAGGVSLRAAPLSVGPRLQESLFRRKDAVVVTSATLAVEGRFEHLAGKLGLDAGAYESLLLETPFRLEEQVAAYSLVQGPDPNDPEFAQSMAAGIRDLVLRLRRKTLVLFTSHDALRRVEALVREPLEERGVRLFAQGLDGGQKAVRDRFQESGPAVLLGAASFWEGVDFPGDDLEILILARLPFLVPADPMVEAISERLVSEGRDPFREYQLLEALIRFRQGFGRLIRRTVDRGLFVVADPRIESRGYGRQFREAVGVSFRRMTGWPELIEDASGWLDRA